MVLHAAIDGGDTEDHICREHGLYTVLIQTY
jgi:hypothetical protein